MKKNILILTVMLILVAVVTIFALSSDKFATNLVQEPKKPTKQQEPQEKVSVPSKPRLTDGEVVFYNDDNLTRPEFCTFDGKAYVTFREIVEQPGKQNETAISLKIFNIDEKGNWTDTTEQQLGKNVYSLYPVNGPDGKMTDQQLVCANGKFYLQFEARYKGTGSENLKKVVVYQYNKDWKLENKTTLFEGTKDFQKYKMDDAGFAFLNNTLWVWVVEINTQRLATGFAMYGLSPETLQITQGPISLQNPSNAPFAGSISFKNDQYHLMTSPKDPTLHNYSQNGLVEYVYDTNWNFVSSNTIENDFADKDPSYVTGYARYKNFDLWGFTLEEHKDQETPNKDAGQVFIGEAWVAIIDDNGKVTFQKVSDNDSTPENNDTRHTEFSVYNDFLYVGYKHVIDPRGTTIKRYTLEKSNTSNTVIYSKNGYSPSRLTIKIGETVTFENQSDQGMWIASDPHPTHTNFPSFDAKNAMKKGESYSFTFTQRGPYSYHNHLKPADKGLIIVE